MIVKLLLALLAAFGAAVLSSVAGYGGGVLSLTAFTGLFGLRLAVPILTIAQLASNGSRAWLNRDLLNRRLVLLFAAGAVPCALAGAYLLVAVPATGLKRLLGVFILGLLLWRRWRPNPKPPSAGAFIGVGAASGVGSALLGSVGPLAAPFWLAYGLAKDAYIGTDAAATVLLHGAKIVGYGGGGLLDLHTIGLGAALIPATVAGGWVGKRVVGRLSVRTFTVIVEGGLLVAAALLLFLP